MQKGHVALVCCFRCFNLLLIDLIPTCFQEHLKHVFQLMGHDLLLAWWLQVVCHQLHVRARVIFGQWQNQMLTNMVHVDLEPIQGRTWLCSIGPFVNDLLLAQHLLDHISEFGKLMQENSSHRRIFAQLFFPFSSRLAPDPFQQGIGQPSWSCRASFHGVQKAGVALVSSCFWFSCFQKTWKVCSKVVEALVRLKHLLSKGFKRHAALLI